MTYVFARYDNKMNILWNGPWNSEERKNGFWFLLLDKNQ